MVDLARQAFSTNNFELAAEIYERTIKENGPNVDLFLGLADSFARGGQFAKAFQAYTNAFRLGKIGADNLKHLVTALVESFSQDCGGNQSDSMNKCSMFTCLLCRGLFHDPVTIKCGHTFCRKCLDRDQSKTCKICSCVLIYRLSRGTNVVLSNLINKWFQESCRASELKAEGNKCFEKADYKGAISCYTEAIFLCDEDHLLYSNRSHAYASLDEYQEALEDAEKVIALRPDWPKGFFRKGTALFGLGQHEDAVIAFLQCLALDKEVATAKEFLSKSLHKVLCQLPPDDPKSHQRQQEANPSAFQRLLNSNFSQTRFLPQTLRHLKHIMDETVETAANFKPTTPSFQGGAANFKPSTASIRVDVATPDSHLLACPDAKAYDNIDIEEHKKRHPEGTSSLSDKQMSLQESIPSCSSQQHQPHRSTFPSPESSCLESPASRKRSRIPSTPSPMSPTRSAPLKCLKSEESQASTASDMKTIDPSLLDAGDLECSLCYRLFYAPVTTPCGHSFCRQCLDRCLDHQTSCPMCKSSLVEYLAERRSAVTEALQIIIETYFCKEHQERAKVHEEELAELARMGQDNQHEIPVFVCTLSFPSVLCPLHIFEPRYRLMIRQCMESGTRQFGMCACFSDNEEGFSEYGCMLEVRDVHFFPDGRSLVDTIGGRRFRVLSRGKRDGYNTAKVEFLQDEIISDAELPEIHLLQVEIYGRVERWLSSLPAIHKTRISQSFGNLPAMDLNPAANPNGPNWAWWCVAVLPIEPRIQLTLLAMTSYRERLEALKRVLTYLGSRRQ